MDNFQIGDAVEVLDDQISGKVTKIEGNIITVALEDGLDRKSTRLNSSHVRTSRMPSSA